MIWTHDISDFDHSLKYQSVVIHPDDLNWKMMQEDSVAENDGSTLNMQYMHTHTCIIHNINNKVLKKLKNMFDSNTKLMVESDM